MRFLTAVYDAQSVYTLCLSPYVYVILSYSDCQNKSLNNQWVGDSILYIQTCEQAVKSKTCTMTLCFLDGRICDSLLAADSSVLGHLLLMDHSIVLTVTPDVWNMLHYTKLHFKLKFLFLYNFYAGLH